MAVLSPNLNVMIKAAKKAAGGLLRDFGELEKLQVSKKGVSNFVTTADLRSEKIIKAELQKARPKFGFLMEESGEEKGESDTRWIVDPLDGTTNFIHGIPFFAISIALEQKGEIVAGVIYNPALDDLFFAEKGNGAYLASSRGDNRLRVSSRKDPHECLVATGAPHSGHGDSDLFLEQARPILLNTAGIRRVGAAALDLAYVASGKFDAFWEMGLKPWDIAAGMLMVKEAGGMIDEVGNKKSSNRTRSVLATGNIIATNMNFYDKFKKLLNNKG